MSAARDLLCGGARPCGISVAASSRRPHPRVRAGLGELHSKNKEDCMSSNASPLAVVTGASSGIGYGCPPQAPPFGAVTEGAPPFAVQRAP